MFMEDHMGKSRTSGEYIAGECIAGKHIEEKRITSKRTILIIAILSIGALALAVGAAHAAKRIQLNSSASFPVDI